MHSYAILCAKKRPTKEVDDVSVGVVALGDLGTCIAPAAVPVRQVLGNVEHWSCQKCFLPGHNIATYLRHKNATYLVTT